MTKRVDEIEKGDVVNEEVKVDADEARAKNLLVYPLVKPIIAYGSEVKVIKMRRPNGKDLVFVGNPVIYFPYADPVRIEHDFTKVVVMVARISDPPIPSKSLEDLDPTDLLGLAWAISPFFIPAR